MNKPLKILCTGANGFTGASIISELLKKLHPPPHIQALSRNQTNLERLQLTNNIHFTACDLSKTLPDEIINPPSSQPPFDLIIHTAGCSFIKQSVTHHDFITSNIQTTENLINYCHKHPPKNFIFLSSISVYGDIKTPSVNERTPFHTPSLYGSCKILAEKLIQELPPTVKHLSLRLPGIIGTGYYAAWLGKTLLKSLQHEPFHAYQPQALFNNLISPQEITRLILHWLNKTNRPSGTFNLAASQPVPLQHLLETLLKITQSQSTLEWLPTPPKPAFQIETNTLESTLHFTPKSTLELALPYFQQQTLHQWNYN